jgi:hypothetical protein
MLMSRHCHYIVFPCFLQKANVKDLEIPVWKAFEITVVASLDRQKHYSFLLPEDKAAGWEAQPCYRIFMLVEEGVTARRQAMLWPL